MIFVSEVIAWAANISEPGTENDEHTFYVAVISDERASATETWNVICDEETVTAGGLGSDGGETWNENDEQLETWNETWIHWI